jgi:hypothetical protein
MKHIVWLSGWGVEPESLRPLADRALPGARHTFFGAVHPDTEAMATADVTVGWSLGARRLLELGASGVALGRKVVLLAPFTSFCAEHGQGGRCSGSQVRWLRRWLSRHPEAALADFHRRARLANLAPAAPTPELDTGLQLLLERAGAPVVRFAGQLPNHWRAGIGREDALLIPEDICAIITGCRLIDGAGHDPAALVEAVFHEI